MHTAEEDTDLLSSDSVYTVAHKKQPLELFAVSLPNLHQCKSKLQQSFFRVQTVFVVEMSQAQVFDNAINIL